MDEYRTITTTDDLDQLFEVTTILDSGDREALMAYVSDQKPVDFALIARDLDAEQLQELTDLLPTAYLANSPKTPMKPCASRSPVPWTTRRWSWS
jgi:hypothetical protein